MSSLCVAEHSEYLLLNTLKRDVSVHQAVPLPQCESSTNIGIDRCIFSGQGGNRMPSKATSIGSPLRTMTSLAMVLKLVYIQSQA